jgi:hypothetical protein
LIRELFKIGLREDGFLKVKRNPENKKLGIKIQ